MDRQPELRVNSDDSRGAPRSSALTRLFDIQEEVVDARTTFLSAKTKRLHDWWASANDGHMPPRAAFDIVDHKLIIPNLFVTEVLDDGNFAFRLFGEEVIAMVGRNRKGELVRCDAVDEYGHALHEYYTSLVTGRVCRKCTGSLAYAGREFHRFESVDCPIGDATNERVAQIIGVMDIIG